MPKQTDVHTMIIGAGHLVVEQAAVNGIQVMCSLSYHYRLQWPLLLGTGLL